MCAGEGINVSVVVNLGIYTPGTDCSQQMPGSTENAMAEVATSLTGSFTRVIHMSAIIIIFVKRRPIIICFFRRRVLLDRQAYSLESIVTAGELRKRCRLKLLPLVLC